MRGLTFYGLFSMRTHCWDEDLNYRFMAFNMDIRRCLFSFHDIHKGGRGERGLMSIARRRSGEAHQNLIFFGLRTYRDYRRRQMLVSGWRQRPEKTHLPKARLALFTLGPGFY